MAKLISRNPHDRSVVGEVHVSTEKEVAMAVQRAHKTSDGWRFLGIKGRNELLLKIHEEFTKIRDELAALETREMGMPIMQSFADIDSGLNYFKWYIDNGEKYLSPEITFEDEKFVHTVYYESTGVAAVISPWNFPFSNFIWGAVQNLVAGNVVVYKHSEECAMFGKKIEEVMSKHLPPGVFSEIYGGAAIGSALVNQDIDIICFTGSTEVGQKIYSVAAQKMIKAVLELGGSAPGIIFEDADIDGVLESVYFNKFLNCGQVCDGLKRLIVHKNIFDKVADKLMKKIQNKKIGNPADMNTDIGPLVSEKQLKLLELQVKDATNKGARVVIGGKRVKDVKGYYYEPTLLTKIKPYMKVWKEEVFGPVLPIVPFNTEDEAIKLANDTVYGLGAYVFTEDKEKAKRVAERIKTGMVAINNAVYVMPCNPFGGRKMSGVGREHGKYGLRELCQIKVVALEK